MTTAGVKGRVNKNNGVGIDYAKDLVALIPLSPSSVGQEKPDPEETQHNGEDREEVEHEIGTRAGRRGRGLGGGCGRCG